MYVRTRYRVSRIELVLSYSRVFGTSSVTVLTLDQCARSRSLFRVFLTFNKPF